MKSEVKRRYEVDLYEPICQYFMQQGYTVHGEVNDCDVVMLKKDELIIIELKLSLTTDLLIQATKRQRLTEQVYIAIPKPSYSLHSKKWKDICYLVRRLELGLIIVTFEEADKQMTIMFHPQSFNRAKSMGSSKKKKDHLLSEINGRHANFNTGGSAQAKIMTAYKESCIHIACCLVRFGPLSPKLLRELGTGEKTQSILSKNYYGWFNKVKRGTYQISEKGLSELSEQQEVVDYYNKVIELNDENLKKRRSKNNIKIVFLVFIFKNHTKLYL